MIDEFSGLLEKLKTQCVWPHKYHFKFLYKKDLFVEKTILSFFEDLSLEIIEQSKRYSPQNNYISLNICIYAYFPEQIISVYKQATSLKGVIIL